MTNEAEQSLRIGLIGTGFIGTTVGGQFHQHSQATVAAVTDIDETACDEAADLFDVPADARFSDYEEMLDEASLDAVLIGTPHTLHYDQITAALDRGLHVLCDKPLTTDLDEAQQLVDRVQGGDEVLMVGYQRHLYPAFIKARERWQDSDTKPQWITAEVSQDWVDRFEGTWRHDADLSGGGYLYDTGSHLLDALLWSTGLKPTEVRANMEFVDDEERIDGRVDLTIRFENGATATCSLSGETPCMREHIHIWDDDGAVYLTSEQWSPNEYAEIDDDSGEYRPHVDNRGRQTKAEAFVEAIRDGTEPPATVVDGLNVTAVTEAAYKAAKTDGWVDVGLD